MADPTTFEGWAILELMGHRRLTGYVSEIELAGAKFLRLDVPADEHGAATCEECGANHGGGCICEPPLGPVEATQFYSPAAVYCLTPTTEELARRARKRPAPVARYELPPVPVSVIPTNEDALDALDEDLDERDDEDDGLPF